MYCNLWKSYVPRMTDTCGLFSFFQALLWIANLPLLTSVNWSKLHIVHSSETGAIHKWRRQLWGGGGGGQKLVKWPTDSTKKLPTWRRGGGVKNLKEMPTSHMDGPQYYCPKQGHRNMHQIWRGHGYLKRWLHIHSFEVHLKEYETHPLVSSIKPKFDNWFFVDLRVLYKLWTWKCFHFDL